MSTARKYQPHYVVADYQQWEGDWELWFGTAVAMAPSPFGPHERAVSELSFQIQSSIKKQLTECRDCQVYTGLDWVVQHDTVVRPDVMLVCGDQPETHLERPPRLIIEVLSESTSEKDQTAKRELYESCGVEHYLLADPMAKEIRWLTLGSTGKYDEFTDLISVDGKFTVELHDRCTINFERMSAFA